MHALGISLLWAKSPESKTKNQTRFFLTSSSQEATELFEVSARKTIKALKD